MVTSQSGMAMASATVCFWCKKSPGVTHYIKYKEPNMGKGFEFFEEKSVQRWVVLEAHEGHYQNEINEFLGYFIQLRDGEANLYSVDSQCSMLILELVEL